MKRTICILLSLVFVLGIMQVSLFSAAAVEDLVPADGEYEMDVYVQEDLPTEVQAQILAYFYGGMQNEPKRNILCDLFGHKNTTSTSVTVSHNVYTTSPKCVQNSYITYTCTRCGNVETVLQESRRISTCHG